MTALRYLIIVTGYAFWVACLGFFLIGCYACARQALADRAMRKAESDAEDADYAALRTEGMGDLRAVPDDDPEDIVWDLPHADEFNRQLRERLREGWKP